ncbi:MAG TPA: helix-turn-helix domain-containing protein [Puia sp.]|jgi:AraC-like DNA-binding protein|nr:helix-turn-helix domain-containing protein [Puia sp.]
MQFDLTDILFLFVLFLLLFITIFLFTSDKGKRISNILIGSFFLALFLNLTDSFLLLKHFYFSFPAFALWGSNLLFVCGPLIFLYTKSVLYKDFRFTVRNSLHFLPFIIFFSALEISYLSAGHQRQMEILTTITERKTPGTVYLASLVVYVHFVIYLYSASRLLIQYRKAASNHFSNAQRATLGWLQTTIEFFFIIILISATNSYLSFQLLNHAYFFVFSIMVFLLLLFVMVAFFKALRNPQIFSGWDEKQIEEALKPAKYASSQLNETQKRQILDRLQLHMKASKPYLEPELTLDELAAQLSLKPKILSQVINELLNQSFFECINSYRIDEAKRLLTHPKDKKITVLEVMYEVGFNSKSSFNTIFKKQTGITPSEFKRQYP